jgi:hypothetical protein
MHAARMRRTEKLDRERSIHQPHMFHRLTCFLAALLAGLLMRVFGALDASFGAIMAKRGGLSLSATSGSSASPGPWLSPKRWAKCSSEPAGAADNWHRSCRRLPSVSCPPDTTLACAAETLPQRPGPVGQTPPPSNWSSPETSALASSVRRSAIHSLTLSPAFGCFSSLYHNRNKV